MKLFGKLAVAMLTIMFCVLVIVGFAISTGRTIVELNDLQFASLHAVNRWNFLNMTAKDALLAPLFPEETYRNIETAREGFDEALDRLGSLPAERLVGAKLASRASDVQRLWEATEANLSDALQKLAAIRDGDLAGKLRSGTISMNYGLLETFYRLNEQGRVTPRESWEMFSFRDGVNSFAYASATFNDLLTELETGIKQRAAEVIRTNLFILIGISIVLIISSLLFVMTFSRRLTGRIGSLETLMGHIADRDFTVRADIRTKDEIGTLGRHVNRVMEALNDFFGAVRTASGNVSSLKDSLSSGTAEAAAAINQISRNIETIRGQFAVLNGTITDAGREINAIAGEIGEFVGYTEHQGKAVAETSSAIEEMSASIRSVSRLTEDRRGEAENLLSDIRDGGEKIEAADSIIKSISREVDGLLEVIEIINGVSEQTNLLSMNAAIESAHAGDAGKGFAVVAEEIRKLAESTSENAQRIDTSLRTMAARIGEALVASTTGAQAFEHINRGVSGFVRSWTEIASSMEELSGGSREVLRSTTEVSEITRSIGEGSQRMEKGAGQLRSAMENVERISSETLLGIGEIDLGAKEILAAMNGISDLAEASRDRMSDLERAISLFKTREVELSGMEFLAVGSRTGGTSAEDDADSEPAAMLEEADEVTDLTE